MGLTSSLLLAHVAQTHARAEEGPVMTPPWHVDGLSRHLSIQIPARLFCSSLISPCCCSPRQWSRIFPSSLCLIHLHTHWSQQFFSPFRAKNRCHRPLLSEFLTPLPLQTYLDFHALLFSFSDQGGSDITFCKGNVEGLRGEIMKLVWVYWLWDIFRILKKERKKVLGRPLVPSRLELWRKA